MADLEYKLPSYFTANETITSAKLNSIIQSYNNLIENLMKHDHNGSLNNLNQTTNGPKLQGEEAIVDNTIPNNKLQEKTIENNKIKNHTIINDLLTDNCIITNNIINGAITYNKLNIYDIFDKIYPVGSIYITSAHVSVCPLETLGIGQWELVAQNRSLQGANDYTSAGTTIEAGLPNITGGGLWWESPGTGDSRKSQIWGSFYVNTNVNNKFGSGDADNDNRYIDFDASRSSSIYGAATTVQPPAYLVNVFRRKATTDRSLIIESNHSDAIITVIINGVTYTVSGRFTSSTIPVNSTYSYSISKSEYITETGNGTLTNNTTINKTLLPTIINIPINEVYTLPVNELYSYTFQKSGKYRIELGGGKTVSDYNTLKGGLGILETHFNENDTLSFYNILGGYYGSIRAGSGLGIKLDNQWIIIVGGSGVIEISNSFGGGGYLGGKATSYNIHMNGYNCNNETGTGTGDTNGSGESHRYTNSFFAYGGTGWVHNDYINDAVLTTAGNTGDIFAKITYIGL